MPIPADMKSMTREFWNSNPCGLSHSWEHSKYVRYHYTDPYLLKYLKQDFFSGKRVLEVGCGQGLDASEIVKYCDCYIGIDLSEGSLQIAHDKMLELKNDKTSMADFLNNDAESLAFKDSSFDVVYSIGVLHHTHNFEKSLAEIYRVLKKDGIFILMVYRKYTPIYFLINALRIPFHIPLIGLFARKNTLGILRGRNRDKSNSLSGTTFIELVGSPIINTYSTRELSAYFKNKFAIFSTDSYRIGIDQIIRFLPKYFHTYWPKDRIDKIEEKLRGLLGFYLVVMAKKL